MKFYTDANIAKAVAEQLRKNGIDCIRCEEVNMAEASDLEHLEYATEQKRVLVSFDQDMTRLHKEWMEAGKTHAGVIFVQRSLQGTNGIGAIVKQLLEWHQDAKAEMQNQLRFIS